MNSEHCICVRHTSVQTKAYQHKGELNGQYNGRAKFFLNDDELTLSSSYESRKDYQLSYDKYSNGRNSISSDKSDESTKSKLKKSSFNSKFRLGSEKATFFLGNNLSLYKSENNLDNKSLTRDGRRQMTKSNSFNNIINNYRNASYRLNQNNENYHSTINNHTVHPNCADTLPRQPRLITQFSTILFLINPYDARISKFETDYVKIAQLNPIRTFLAIATNYTVHAISIRSCKVIATAHMEETVDYITWLTPLIVAIVTTRTVYHWDLKNNTNQPVIAFFKSPKIYHSQIVNYEADDTMSWFALSTLYLEEGRLINLHLFVAQIKRLISYHFPPS